MEELLQELNNKYIEALLIKRSIEVQLNPLQVKLEKSDLDLSRLEMAIAELNKKNDQIKNAT